MSDRQASATVLLTHAVGLHARPSVKLTKLAKTFGATIDGAVTRTEAWWARRLPPDLADTVLYVVDDPGRPGELRGYGSYRHGTARPPYDYSVVVAEVQGSAVGGTPNFDALARSVCVALVLAYHLRLDAGRRAVLRRDRRRDVLRGHQRVPASRLDLPALPPA